MPTYDFIYHTSSTQSEIKWVKPSEPSLFDQVTAFSIIESTAVQTQLFRAISASVFVYFTDGQTPSGSLSDLTRVGLFISGTKLT